jgi:hypothetical protein
VNHTGGIDGFTTFIAFVPEHDIGLVVLNSITALPTGVFFYMYVQNLLLSQRLGLNDGVPAKLDRANRVAIDKLLKTGRASRPVPRRAVAPFVGYYEGGYQLVLHRHEPQILQGPRVMPLRAMARGGYVISDGPLADLPVKLQRDRDGVPRIELVGLETVRRTVGPD